VHRGDKVIVITYADYEAAELEDFSPRVVHVDATNAPVDESTAKLEAEFRRVVAS
jgi:aspartate 1-decarboxylase